MIYMAGARRIRISLILSPMRPGISGRPEPHFHQRTGIQISELLPNMARIMDKWTGIHSIVGAPNGSHDSFMCYSGRKGSTQHQRPSARRMAEHRRDDFQTARHRQGGIPAF